MSICFDFLVTAVDLMRSCAPWLSMLMTRGLQLSSSNRPISIMSRFIQTACFAASEAAIYSASFELVAMHVCFRDFQETGPPASIKTYPLTDRLLSVCTSPQLESEKQVGNWRSSVFSHLL